MGRWHAAAAAHAGAKVVAVVDPDGARAAVLAHRHPGAAVFTDLGHALVVVGPGVVHLCTPLATHAPLALDALAAGHHVLVEKPLVDDLATADVLLRAAESARRLVCPVHQFLFQPGALRVAEVLPSAWSASCVSMTPPYMSPCRASNVPAGTESRANTRSASAW